MTVLDSSAAVDYLVGGEAKAEVAELLKDEDAVALAAPETFVFEVVSALRRLTMAGDIAVSRATAAVEDLGSVRVDLFPTLPLRQRAWDLRENITAYDAAFVALAELLDEPLATMDRALARAIAKHTNVEAILLGA